MPSNARKNATTSSITSEPTTLRDRAQERLHGHAGDLEGRARRHHQQPEDAVVEQPHEPARRVEEVERVAGRWRVDDDEIEAAFVVQLVQLLHRHVLLRAAERAGDVAVEAVVEDALGLVRLGRVAGDEPVERRLRVEHQRREPAAPVVDRPGAGTVPARRGRSRSACRRVPRARARSASRLAGSIVTTHALRPRRAPSSASTAAVVVLPTPPLPQQMIDAGCSATSLGASSSQRGSIPRGHARRRARRPATGRCRV